MRVILLCLLGLAAATKADDPIGKVVELLGELKGKVEDEGAAETKLHEERVEAQRVREDELNDNIQDATRHADKAKAEAESAEADVAQLATTIEELGKSIAAREAEVAEAKETRNGEHKNFQGKEAELTEAIDTLARAKNILKKQGLGFAQIAQAKENLQSVANTLQLIVKASSISAKGQAQLTALLQGGNHHSDDDDSFLETAGAPTAAAYESHSGGIIDLISELEVEAKGELGELRKAEMNSKHAFAMLEQGANDELKIMNRDLKNAQKELAVRKEAGAKNRQVLADNEASLADDSAELSALKETRDREAAEFTQHQQDRHDEVAAIDQAKGILTDDSFAKATNFMQMESHDGDVRSRIAAMLQEQAKHFNSRALAQLASRTRVGNDTFGKIRGMISDMITRLEEEAAKEASHNDWCNAEKKESNAKKEKLNDKIEELSARTEGVAADIAQTKEDISSLSAELAASAEALRTATAQRTEQNEQYTKDKADYETGIDGLQRASQALSDFFSQNRGGHGDAGGSIIGILEVAETDFSKMLAEANTAEEAAAKAFKKLKQETEVSTAQKEAMIKTKESSVKSQESANADYKEDLEGFSEEMDAVLKYLETVREKCTHKPQTFEERAAKMQAEIAGLKQALEILENETAGGDAFLQKRAITKHM